MLVDVGHGRAVPVARIRDKIGTFWLGFKQLHSDLVPHVARQSLLNSLKRAGNVPLACSRMAKDL